MFDRSMHRHWVRLQRALAAVVLSMAVALGSTGCAGGGDRGDPTPSPSTGASGRTDPAAALVKFHACLRANGVEVSDSGPGVQARGEVEEDPNFPAAAAACKHHLAGTAIEVATGEGGGHLSEDQLESLLAYTGCMRDHGVDMPDPDPDNGVVAPKGGGEVDQETEEFKTAHPACRSHLSDTDVTGGGSS